MFAPESNFALIEQNIVWAAIINFAYFFRTSHPQTSKKIYFWVNCAFKYFIQMQHIKVVLRKAHYFILYRRLGGAVTLI